MDMKRYPSLFRTVLPIAVFLFAGAAHASTMIDGVAVGAPGVGETPGFGSIGNGPSLSNAIEYFIPLTDATNGIYGVGSNCSGNAAGTCADTGSGSGYANANALQMNLFFDLSLQPASKSAELSFLFDDLDLDGANDPPGFYESISLSYWDSNSANFVNVTGPITDVPPDPSIAPLSPPEVDAGDPNLITWDTNLISWQPGMLALAALNDSAQAEGGFWIQLGFGSKYVYTTDGTPRRGTNTPEYLTAQLTVSPVPVPAAVWLFGTALIGFVGMSRRTKIS